MVTKYHSSIAPTCKHTLVQCNLDLLKNLRNLHCRFVLCSYGQIYGGDFAKIFGLLKIYELYTFFNQWHHSFELVRTSGIQEKLIDGHNLRLMKYLVKMLRHRNKNTNTKYFFTTLCIANALFDLCVQCTSGFSLSNLSK